MKKKIKNNKIKRLIQLITIAVFVLLLLVFCGKNEGLTVTFNIDGKEYHEINNIKHGNTIEEPKDPEKEGYSFAGWFLGDEEFNFDKPVDKNIELDAKWDINKYAVTINTGTGSIINETINYNDTITEPNTPSKEGYIFVGWYFNDEIFDFSTKVNSDLNIEARWTNQIYSNYKVEHYLMGKDGKYIDAPSEVETLTGKIGSIVTPSTKEYKGYTSPDVQELIVSADGMATVRYYYSINKYKATLKGDDGVKDLTGDGEYFYNDKVDINYIIKDGYSLVSISETLVDNTYTMADNDVIIEFITEQNKDTKYVVKHYKMNTKGKYSNSPSEVEELYGTTDTNVTPSVKTYVGFTSPKATTVNVDGNGKTVVKYYYERNKYELTLTKDKGVASVIGEGKYYFEEEITIKANIKDGYTFNDWSNGKKDLEFVYKIPAENTSFNASTTVNIYTIKYNLNNGTATNVGTYTVEDEIVLNDAEKLGYTFTGWTGDKISNNKISLGTTGNLEITANFIANTYKITLDKNGGEGQDQVIQTAFDRNTLLPSKPYTRLGYTFIGWSTTATGEVEYLDEANVTNISTGDNVTLYAVWEINTYNIVYNLNNGTNGNNPTTYTVEDEILLNAAEKLGYTFIGWSGDSTGIIAKGTTGDLVINANYEIINYTITYHLNGGTTTNVGTYTVEDEIVLNDAEKLGYTFTGWSGDSTGIIAQGTTGDLDITANYIANTYTVTYDVNGGEVTTPNKEVTYDLAYGELVTPTREGYTFNGWYLNGIKVTLTTIVNTASAHTLVADWTANTYKITLDKNGGEGQEQVIQTAYDRNTILPAKPYVRLGYTFTGWSTTATGEVEYLDEENVTNISTGDNVTLYAVWEINTYNIVYNLNNGTNGNNPTTYTVEDEIILSDATKTGYTFTGWSGDSTGIIAKGTTGDLEITATFTANKYTIIYDPNGGSVTLGGKEVTYDLAYGNLVIPIREGYTFTGWYFNGNKVDNNTLVNTTENHTLVASWSKNKYIVTFDSNGGTNVDSIEVYYNDLIDEPTTPTRIGHTFGGWYLDGEEFSFSNSMPARNITLKAKWKVNSTTIGFDTNGGSIIDAIIQNYGTTVIAPQDPTREGYTFAGWYADEELIEGYIFTTMPADGITVYAKWTANTYIVTYDANDGEVTPTTKEVTYDLAYGELAEPTREGYTFNGWYLNGVKVTSTTIVKTVSAHTLVADWIANTYIVTYDANGGEVTTSNKEVTYDLAYGELLTPTREGYTFNGWYLGTNEITSSTIVNTASNHTLVADWIANTYKITLDKNNGEGQDRVIQTAYDRNTVLPTEPYSRRGYTFVGWSTAPDGEVEYVDGVNVTNISTGDNVTLYAVWEINTYTITYHLNGGTTTNVGTYTVEDEITLSDAEKLGYTFTGWSGDSTGIIVKGTTGALDVTANYEIINYTITYHLNGGTTTNVTTYTVEDRVTLSDAEKLGYTFTGWSGDSTGIIAQGTTGDLDITANYIANTYTVTYDANGGELTTPTKEVTYDLAYEELAEPTREGYTFNGWYLNGTKVTSTTIVKTASAHTLVADWTANTYTVTYDANGGEVTTLTKEVTYDLTYGELPTLEREGYTFNGWYLGNIEITSLTIVKTSSDHTLVAKWTANTYTVTYDANSGELTTPTKEVTYDLAYGDLATPTREGYTFNGWYLNGTKVTSTTMVKTASTHTLVADWTANTYTVTYDANGGEVTTSNKEVTYDLTYGELATPERTGYTFNGWYLGTNEITSSTVVNTSNNHTLIADWTANTYKITLDKNNGEGQEQIIQTAFDRNTLLPSKPYTRLGYTFKGWSTTATGEVEYVDGVNVTNISTGDNVTLYAVWEINTYTITYHLNGGTTTNVGTYTVEDRVTLSDAEKLGYTFTGWSGDSTGIIVKGTTGDLEITANYEIINYTITYHLNGGTTTNVGTYTVEDEIVLNDAEKLGYTFTGWSGDSTGIIAQGTTGDLDITANYEIINYTITYHLNGGTTTNVGTYTVEDRVTLSDAEKLGYTFTGWSGDSTGVIAQGTTGDLEITANFAANTYRIILDKNSGEGQEQVIQTAYDMDTVLPETPYTKLGYTFKGWSTSANNDTVTYSDKQNVTNISTGIDVTLYAVWEANSYTVTYNPNGGSVNPTTKTVTYNSIYGELLVPVRKGYTFTGWYTSVEGGTKIESTTTITILNDQTLYAHWTVNSYTVTYDANGGTVSAEPKTITYGSPYGELPTPTRNSDDYAFAGWYTSAEGGTRIESTTILDNDSNHTIYAHWNIIPKIQSVWFDIYNKNTKDSYYSEMENNAYFIGNNSFYVRLPRDSSIDVKKIGIKTNIPVYINPENTKDTSGKYFEITATNGYNAGGPGKYTGTVELDAGIASDTLLLKSSDGGSTWISEDSMSVTALEFKDVFTKPLSLAKGLAKSYEGEESPRYISTLVNDPTLNYYFMFFKQEGTDTRKVEYVRIENGKEIVVKTMNVPIGSRVPKIDEFQIAGYTFNGWYTNKEFNNNIQYYDVIVEEDTKIYGNYERLPLDTTWYSEPEEGNNKYCIRDASDLKGFAYLVNTDKITFQGQTVQLCDDIVLESDYNWVPIENFKGTFEGNLHTIKNLNITTGTNQVGFFKTLSNVTIQNVIFDNANINATSSSSVAVLVGEGTKVTFSRIAIKNSKVNGNQNTGGVIGNGKDIIADQIYIDNTKVAGGDRDAGGFAADLVLTDNTTGYISLTNIYANADITSNYASAPDTGGVVGALYTPAGYDTNNIYNNFKLNNIIFTGSVKEYQACIWIFCTYINSFGAIYGRFGISGNNNDQLGPLYTNKSTLLYDKQKITLTQSEFLEKGTGYNTSYLQNGDNYSTEEWNRTIWYFDSNKQNYPTFTWLVS